MHFTSVIELEITTNTASSQSHEPGREMAVSLSPAQIGHPANKEQVERLNERVSGVAVTSDARLYEV